MIQQETVSFVLSPCPPADDSRRELIRTLDEYRPHVRIELDTSRYTIRTARNGKDLMEALSLRHRVFYQELLGIDNSTGLDFDVYDILFDHILLIEKSSDKLVGTYRLNCSKYTNTCYTDSEFNCRNLDKLPGVRLELGRACLDPDFRSGVHFILLWRGILAYAQATDSRYLYGCASIKTTDPGALARIYRELDAAYGCSPKWRIRPRKDFAIAKFGTLVKTIMPAIDCQDPLGAVPSLLWFYFKAGAKICGEPAIDTAFECADFPIILDLEEARHPLRQKIAG